MIGKSGADENNPSVVDHEPEELRGILKLVGGSNSDDWNNILVNQALRTI